MYIHNRYIMEAPINQALNNTHPQSTALLMYIVHDVFLGEAIDIVSQNKLVLLLLSSPVYYTTF